MSDNTRKASAGSISGFTEINLTEEGTVAEARPAAPLSATELIRRMNQLRKDMDPNTLNALLDKVEDHILAEGNVHDMTFSDLGEGALAEIAEAFFPGTVPSMAPSLHAYAGFGEILSDITVTRNSPLWVMSASGLLEEVAVDTLGVDYSISGIPTIPMFPTRSNYFTESNAVSARSNGTGLSRLLGVGASVLQNSSGTIKGPDGTNNVVICSDIAASGMFGVTLGTLNAHEVDTTCNVVSAYILPLSKRYLTLQLVDLDSALDVSTISAVVDTETAEVISLGAGAMAAYVHKTPSGYLRVALQYAVAGTTGISLNIVAHDDPENPVYVGVGEQLFAIFGLSNTKGAGLSPFIPTSGATATLEPTTLSITAGDQLHSSEGIIALQWGGYHNTSKSTGLTEGTDLLKIDGVDKITLGDTGYNVSHGAVSFNRNYTNDSFVTHALSYSAEEVRYKGTDTVKSIIPGTYASFAGPRVLEIGPVPGYFHTLTLYPLADLYRVLDYIVGQGD